MHRIDGEANDNGLFRAGDPQGAFSGTVVTAEWLNDIQEGLIKVIETAGLTPIKGRDSDLLDAIHQRIEAMTGTPLSTIEDLRENTSTQKLVIMVADTPSVFWFKDPYDLVSIDNGTSVVVDAIGQRWRPRPTAGGIVYNDGSTTLEDLKPANPGATNRKTFYQNLPPTNPGDELYEGDLWFDTNDGNKQYRWSGSAWEVAVDLGAEAGRNLSIAAAAAGRSIEQVVADAVAGAEGTPVSSANVNSWSGEYTPTSRAHALGVMVNRASGRVTIKHRGLNGHTGIATATIELEVKGNTLDSYENVNAENALTGNNSTAVDFEVDANKWGPNGLVWSETLSNVETDSFNVYLTNYPVTNETVFRIRIREADTTDLIAQTWIYGGDTPIILDPPTPMQIVLTISDTTNQDVLLMINAPETAGANARATTISIKKNYSTFTTPNPGEVYIHGFDAAGDPADVNGFFVHNGQIVTIDRTQALYTGSTNSGYIIYDTSHANSFVMGVGNRAIALGIKRAGQWWYDNNTATIVRFTPTDNMVVIGTLKVEDDNVLEATIWPYGIAMGVIADANANVTETYPLANLNVNEWYTSPYSPTVQAAMFRVRINRPSRIVEVLFGGFSSHTGAARVDVELEIQNNTFTAYTNINADTSLTNHITDIDFDSDVNYWGPNGIRWSETASGTDTDRFEMTTATVPGAATTFRLRLRVFESDNHVAHLALGDLMVGVDPRIPLELVFSPRDGTDYDVLIMTNGPSDAGATNRKTFYQTTAPVNPGADLHTGDLWFDTDDGNKQYRWDGTVWVLARDAGAAAGAALSQELTNLGVSITNIAANAEGVPMGATNVTEWYTSPYSPTGTAAMLRVRIDRASRIVEIQHSGHNGLVGLSSVDIELEVFNNTFTAYTNYTSEVTLTNNLTNINFETNTNRWGPNGLRWAETLTGTDADKFEMTLANVPGANTVFRMRVRTFTTAGGPSQLALGNMLLVQSKSTPFYFFFSPTDGTDYDVLVMQNAPADAGATNRKTFYQTTAPANPGADLHTGDLWFDTDDGNKQYRWDGTTWIEVIDNGATTGREVSQAIADQGLSQTVADFIASANDGGSSIPIAAQNVSDWSTYWTPNVVGRGTYLQVKVNKTTGTVHVRHKTQNGHTGIAAVKIELEPIDNSVASFTNVSSALTPVNDVGGVNFADDLATTKLRWGPNGVIYHETITNIGEHEFYITCATAPITRDHNFRLKIRYHYTNDNSASVYHSLGDTALPARVSAIRPKQLFFGPIDSNDYDVLVMEGSEPILAGTGGSFRNGFERTEIDKWTGSAVSAYTSSFYSGSQSGLFTYTGSAPAADGTTGAARIQIPDRWALEFAGQRVRVSLYAKKPPSSAATTFAVAYSTNQSTQTSGWQNFSPTTSWVKYIFNYDVPTSTQAGPHYLGVHADTSNSGLGVLIDNIIIECVQKPSEIDGSALLNVSQLISSVEVSINETTTTTTLFSTGTDYNTWVDVVSTTVNTTGTDLVVVNGSAEMLIDRTVDTSDVTIVSLNITSTSGWTLNTGWTHIVDKIYHTDPSQTATLDYAITGLTAGMYYRVEANVVLFGTPTITMSISSGGVNFEGSNDTTNIWDDATSNFVSFKATGTTATLRFQPDLSFEGYVDYVSVKRTAPGIQNQPIGRQTAGPGGPTIEWRLLRGVSVVHTSSPLVISGAGQVPALFLDQVDTSSPGGSQTYKFQVKWKQGAYDAGQIASWDINDGRPSRMIGTGTYWGTYMAPGAIITWTSDNLTVEVISVLSNTEVLVIPTYFVSTTSSFTSGTGATVAVPTGAKSARIRLYGGGGGGSYNLSVGWGGGAGGYCEKFVTFTSTDAGKLFTYTVGGGGAGKTSGSTGAGSNGGNTTLTTSNMSFTNLNMTANGGSGGGTGANGSGGSASGGDVNITGGSGVGNQGGEAYGQEGGIGGSITGQSGSNYGGGGAGGDSSGPLDGGNGAGGYVVIDFLPDFEGSTATNYTSSNSTHKLIMRQTEAFIQCTEYRN